VIVLRILFAVAAVAYLVGIVIQVLLAGAAVFDMTDFDAHRMLGWGLASAPTLLIPLAIAARASATTFSLTVALAFDALFQPELAAAREDEPVIAAFHPVNALLIYWLALLVAHRAIAHVRERNRPAEPATAGVRASTASGGD
jgi:hypothetical protein